MSLLSLGKPTRSPASRTRSVHPLVFTHRTESSPITSVISHSLSQRSPTSSHPQLYGLIARGKDVLCEYTAVSGNFPTITRLLLGKIPRDQDGKRSYVYDAHVFHYLVSDGLTYLCMTDDPQQQRFRAPFAYLDDIQTRFLSMYGRERAQTAFAFAMNEEFSRILQRQMDFFNSPNADASSTLQAKLDDVRNIMISNVDLVLERGEKLELLVDKTADLQHSAFKFERSSRQLRNEMLWRRIRCYGLIAVGAGLLLFFITATACGFDFKGCGKE